MVPGRGESCGEESQSEKERRRSLFGRSVVRAVLLYMPSRHVLPDSQTRVCRFGAVRPGSQLGAGVRADPRALPTRVRHLRAGRLLERRPLPAGGVGRGAPPARRHRDQRVSREHDGGDAARAAPLRGERHDPAAARAAHRTAVREHAKRQQDRQSHLTQRLHVQKHVQIQVGHRRRLRRSDRAAEADELQRHGPTHTKNRKVDQAASASADVQEHVLLDWV